MKTDKQLYDDVEQARKGRRIDLTDWERGMVDLIDEILTLKRDLSVELHDILNCIHGKIKV